MEVAIIGGGIVGLALALGLKQRGINSRVYESAPEIREIGVGITLLPHAMRELTALDLGNEARAAGIELNTSAFYNRFGQKIYSEPRGLAGGSPYPEVSIHRGRLHTLLYKAALSRVGADRIHTDCQLAAFQQDEDGVTLSFRQTSTGEALPPVRASVVIGCDGVNSVTRKILHPDDQVVFTGINTWRGTTRRKPILDGRTYLRIGSIRTGKMVIYPIIDDIDGDGNQLINWVAEIEQPTSKMNDWNRGGKVEDFLSVYQGWKFEWLDVEKLILDAGTLLEYPMVDKDPLDRWTFGRVTLAGDAAHPMYPRGSNGSAQGLIDARALSECLARNPENPQAALKAYEAERLEPTGQVVRANRTSPPDIINIRVEELTGDRPFDNLDDYISHEELRALSEQYKRVAGFSASDLAKT